MNEFWQVVVALGTELHPHQIEVLASKIQLLESAQEFNALKMELGPGINRELLQQMVRAWRNCEGISPKEVAAALRASSVTSSFIEQRSSVELVWTGPSTGLISTRNTERVLCEVIESAKKRLFLVSFVAYEVPSIVQALRSAANRQVRIDIIIELSNEYGGQVSFDFVKAMRESVPAANIYVWEKDHNYTSNSQSIGAVHAKCAVADKKFAFITSANLSKAAMERNMELGVLLKGGNLPVRLERHLDALIITGILRRV